MKTAKPLFFLCSLTKLLLANLKFEFASQIIPFPAKKEKGGEDALFTSELILSVADGVGGWNLRGVDPAVYSRRLMKEVEKAFKENPEGFCANPKTLLVEAATRNTETGSSTILIATLDNKSKELRTSYIGDSGYMLLRSNKSTGSLEVVYKSKEQQHRFNFPFQIGSIGDEPETALEFSHNVLENDVLVLGSDGLFDNLSSERILDLLNSLEGQSLEIICVKLAELAYEKSLDTSYDSPFAIGARNAGFYFIGGKSDDITVVVAKIVKNSVDETN